MELDIQELDIQDDLNYDLNNMNVFGFNQHHEGFEEIPENMPIKVIKKNVQFEAPMKPMHQVIPKEHARMVRPNIPNPKPQISYEDILSKMGMFVSDGKLHLLDDVNHQQQQQIKQQIKQQLKPQIKQQQQQQQQQQHQQQPLQQNIPPNSYIYNKYFKEEHQDNIRRPTTKNEYRKMLLEDILQKERIKQIKSRRLVMPTSNISISSGNSGNFTNLPNKLFNFSEKKN
jgi:hypothetical protein